MNTDFHQRCIDANLLETRVVAAKQQLAAVLKEWAAASPYKVGDLLTIPPGATAAVGRQCRISGVGVARSRCSLTDEWVWRIWGTVLKKDGLPSNDGMLSTHFEMKIKY